MRRGFTFFEVLLVIFTISAVGMVAIPAIVNETLAERDADCVALLTDLAVAQIRAHASPRGTYAYLSELLPQVRPDAAAGARADFTRVGGYYLAAFLPDAAGDPLPWTRRAAVTTDTAARAFLILAWPVKAGETGRRPYALGPDFRIWEYPGNPTDLEGPHLPACPLSPLHSAGPLLPAPWRVLLPEARARVLRDRLERAGLPLPPSLASQGR